MQLAALAEPLAAWLALAGPPQAAALLAAGAAAMLGLRALWRLAARDSAHPLAIADQVRRLDEGQQQLLGALTQIAQAQAAAQMRLTQTLESRLEHVQARMGDSLSLGAARTARSLGDLQQRLEAIDRAQGKIERLSGDVLGLQAILSNKQTRGAFGEIQLAEIVSRALPPDAYTLQATLSNGRRADCLIHLAHPPGPMAIDSKFPLEAYEALVAAGTEEARRRAAAALRASLSGHIRDIAARYILPGETAECALLFLPSEAVYAELHARFGDVVRQGFERQVWIVSPGTAMAVLTTLRGVMRDMRLAREAVGIRRELGLLHADLGRLAETVDGLSRHLAQAGTDIDRIGTIAGRAGRRAARLEAADFSGQGEAAEPRDRDAAG